MQARTRIAVVVAIVGLAACAGTDTQAPQATAATTTTVAATTTTAAGPAAFVAEARAMNFGNKDFATATDDQLLELGNVVCEGLGSGLDFGRIAQGLGQTDAKPTTEEATTLAKSAVRHLCPQYAGAVPS
jgi:hypothetical protein